ncbi:uncharacterized protein LOC129951708 isoform X2 [Eupeodes corollae]|uniref:uncharacterized protein LOC129951708 isoform X2 n=1 Tax=Eupeodes corollae TaxID=290404 RepID=UPI00248F93EA|nr:uncharacterized protein LOC129951708 isoform X2 [Eupeodes corollae]
MQSQILMIYALNIFTLVWIFAVDLTTAYSPLGDSRFIKQPFQLKKRPVCCFYNTTYKNHIEPSFMKHSDFPIIPPEGLCPLPKGTFYINEVSIVDDNLPSHLGRGLWRLEERLYKGNECVGGVRVFVQIKDKH